MSDLRRTGLLNQKREGNAGVFPLVEADIIVAAVAANPAIQQIAVPANTAIVANLPARSVITGIRTIVTTASTTAGANISMKVGATVIAANVAVATRGVKVSTPPASSYFPTGGQIAITPGTVAPAAGNLVCEVVVEFIELDKLEGEYLG